MSEDRVSYQVAWRSASLQRLMFLVDPAHEGDMFWKVGESVAQRVCKNRPPLAKVVVDYGCGIGRVLVAMPGMVRIGIDVSQSMIDAAHKLIGGDCIFIRGDGTSIPLPAKSVDFLYSVLTLQHMDARDAASVVSDTYRVLRPGGSCYFEFSAFGLPWKENAELPRRECEWQLGVKGSIGGGHDALCYTDDIVRELARKAKFSEFAIGRHGPARNGYITFAGKRE